MRVVLFPALVVVFIGMLVTSANGHVKAGWADALVVVTGLIFLGSVTMWTYRLRAQGAIQNPVFPNADSSRPPP
jgi:hypothetical protein